MTKSYLANMGYTSGYQRLSVEPLRSTPFLPFDFHAQDTLGFCFVSGSPPTPEATERLANRIGFIRETHCEISLDWFLCSILPNS